MNWRYKIAKWLCPDIFDHYVALVAWERTEKESRDATLAAIRLRSLKREVNLHRSAKRPRTKFKKWWPHGKRSG